MLFILPFFCFSQVKISGKITHNFINPVAQVNIIARDTILDNILAYTTSNVHGDYILSFSSNVDIIELVVTSIDYESQYTFVNNITQVKNFDLSTSTANLDELVIEVLPIKQKKDTLEYNVAYFANDIDRSIEDVLKRFPGLDVMSDGKIIFQGKSISNLYINNLDLLGGNYNLATSSLPYKEISKVQILENHQNIKVLDSLVSSNQVAVNLVLKNSYTFTGKSELGLGATPTLWDVNITPMLFTNKGQMVSSIKSNNVGVNINNKAFEIDFADYLNTFEKGNENYGKSSILSVSPPLFPESIWLNNTSNLFTTNYLVKLSNNFELKTKISYFNNYEKRNGTILTKYITPSEIIEFYEINTNNYNTNDFNTSIELNRNSSGIFFNNIFSFNGSWLYKKGVIENSSENVLQRLTHNYTNFSNTHKAIYTIGKQLINFESYVGYNETPQRLAVNPGQFINLINDSIPYAQTIQNNKLKALFLNNSIGITKAIKYFTLLPKIGFIYDKQQFDSHLFALENPLVFPEFENNTNWNRFKFYTVLNIQFKKRNWIIDFSNMLNTNNYKISDPILTKSYRLNKVTYDPFIQVSYAINSSFKIISSIGYKTIFGKLDQISYAYFLYNYRSISRMEAPLEINKQLSANLNFEYKLPVSALFINGGYSHVKFDSNLFYDFILSSNGTSNQTATMKSNYFTTESLSGRVSKNFYNLKLQLDLNGNYSWSQNERMLNNNLSIIKSTNTVFGVTLYKDIFEFILLQYKNNWKFINTTIETNKSSIVVQNHELELSFKLFDSQYLILKNIYNSNKFNSQSTNNYFLDFVYRYAIKPKSIDLEFNLINIFNTKNYYSLQTNDFTFIESNYALRPRQALIRVKFSL